MNKSFLVALLLVAMVFTVNAGFVNSRMEVAVMLAAEELDAGLVLCSSSSQCGTGKCCAGDSHRPKHVTGACMNKFRV